MRFLCIYKPGTTESNTPPTPEEQAKMGKLIGDMAKAGVLLSAEGCLPSVFGSRVRLEPDGNFRVTDGPFPETHELIAGFCLLQVKTKAEAIEWTKRFVALVKDGESEVRQLHDAPAG
ncbi:MAG TPA: YciI family protein [Polyangiaceae bacterium]|nr:YciI family protein [Polyangiaceae bacterium]